MRPLAPMGYCCDTTTITVPQLSQPVIPKPNPEFPCREGRPNRRVYFRGAAAADSYPYLS